MEKCMTNPKSEGYISAKDMAGRAAYYKVLQAAKNGELTRIKRGRKITLPDYPPITLYHWSDTAFNLGITNTEIEGFKVRIYDVEKCVCDAVKYRNKIGIDVCTEIIKEYLKRRDRNVSKLMKYASQLRVAKTLGTYLQMEL